VKNWKVKLTEDAKQDFKSLEGSQRKLVLKQLLKLEKNPYYGKPLGNKLGLDLTGYYKLYADKKKIRIIYTLERDTIKVIAIDKREDLKVYKIASERIKKLRD
jgi:mRNA interferase RelE/StbE